MKTCLIVDDVEVTRFTGNLCVEELGVVSVEARDREEALKKFQSHNVDVVLMDWHLKKESGIGLMKEIQALKSGVPVIMFSAVEGADKASEAIKAGASGFITKPTTKEKIEKEFRAVGII